MMSARVRGWETGVLMFAFPAEAFGQVAIYLNVCALSFTNFSTQGR